MTEKWYLPFLKFYYRVKRPCKISALSQNVFRFSKITHSGIKSYISMWSQRFLIKVCEDQLSGLCYTFCSSLLFAYNTDLSCVHIRVKIWDILITFPSKSFHFTCVTLLVYLQPPIIYLSKLIINQSHLTPLLYPAVYMHKFSSYACEICQIWRTVKAKIFAGFMACLPLSELILCRLKTQSRRQERKSGMAFDLED